MTPERARCPIVILISGRGSNMRALIEHSRREESPYSVAAVLSDRPEAAGLRVAESLGVSARALKPEVGADRGAYDDLLANAISEFSPALVVMAGFMRIVTGDFVQRFEGQMLNIHPSLLPRHPGLHTHRRVLEAGDVEHGATVHYVTAELDGGPRLLQARLAVDPKDDEATLAARVQTLEHRLYPLAVRWHCEGRFRYVAGKATFDSSPLVSPLQLSDVEHA